MDNTTGSTSQPILLDSDSGGLGLEKEPSVSRSTSSLNLLDQPPLAPAPVGRPKRKDKGKGKEVDSPPLQVKEEPKSFLLGSPEPPPSNLVRPRLKNAVLSDIHSFSSSIMRIIAPLAVLMAH